MLCKRKGFDIVSGSEMNCNRSSNQLILLEKSYTYQYYMDILQGKSLSIADSFFCKIYVIFAI